MGWVVITGESDIGAVRPREIDGQFVQWVIRFIIDAKVLVKRGREEERKDKRCENRFFKFSFFFLGPRNENFLVFVGVFGWKESERGKKIFIFIYFYYLKFFYLKYDVAFFLNTSIYYILLFIIFLSISVPTMHTVYHICIFH